MRRTGHKHLKIAAVALALCVLLTGTAFAINRIFLDRADGGASWVLISAPEDYYESNDMVLYRGIYSGNEYVTIDRQPRVDAETARVLRELFVDVVFNADGKSADFVAAAPDSNDFRIDIGNGALYNAAGEALWSIYYLVIGYGEPQEIEIQTKAEYEEQRESERHGLNGIKLTDDYEEATSLLGADFRLPGVYTEGRNAPEFRFQDALDRKAVYVTYAGNPSIYYFAETLRDEEENPREWYANGAVIEQCEIEGKMVYKATAKDTIRYTWTHDSVVYMIFQDYSPDEFTDEQFVEIIASMIR